MQKNKNELVKAYSVTVLSIQIHWS